jgi:hypothetical protein
VAVRSSALQPSMAPSLLGKKPGAASLIELAPMQNAIVRAAQLADVEQIIQGYEWLFEAPASTPPQWDPERAAAALRRAISSDSAVVFIATLDGQVVGLCTAYTTSNRFASADASGSRISPFIRTGDAVCRGVGGQIGGQTSGGFRSPPGPVRQQKDKFHLLKHPGGKPKIPGVRVDPQNEVDSPPW